MVMIDELVAYLHTTLNVDAFSDYCPNGLQVSGTRRIRRIMTGVSVSQALIKRAIEWKADLLLVHHGLLWDKESRVVTGSYKKRLKRLLAHDITLLAYHLPLDAHPTMGNNAQLLRQLDLSPAAPFGHYRGAAISFVATPSKPLRIKALARKVTQTLGGKPLVLPFGRRSIGKVAVCSGGAPDLIREAKAVGADLFLTGEASEWVYHFAREEKIHFIAAGHHRTETLGVKALGKHLRDRWDLAHRFEDSANPV